MAGVSKIDQQADAALREEIYARFDANQSVDKVYEFLTGQDIETSRAGVGRFRLNWLKAVQAERELTRLTEMTVRDLADAPEQKFTRKLSALVHSGLLRVLASLEERLEADPKKCMTAFVEAAKAAAALARAERDIAETAMKVHEFQEAEAEKAAQTLDCTGGKPAIEITFVPVPGKEAAKPAKQVKKAKTKPKSTGKAEKTKVKAKETTAVKNKKLTATKEKPAKAKK